jgi:hypothetical protein
MTSHLCVFTATYAIEDTLDWRIGAYTFGQELIERAWASLPDKIADIEGLVEEIDFHNDYFLVNFLAPTRGG